MSNHNHKLQHQTEQEQTTVGQHAATSRSALEFKTAEEAIRHDAAATELPPAIAERLKKSLEEEPKQPERPWWRKLFGG